MTIKVNVGQVAPVVLCTSWGQYLICIKTLKFDLFTQISCGVVLYLFNCACVVFTSSLCFSLVWLWGFFVWF